MKPWRLVLIASAIACPATAQVMMAPNAAPRTNADAYRTGEQFARCNAAQTYIAALAREEGRSDLVSAFDNSQQPWRRSGLFLLSQGLDPLHPPQPEADFDRFQASKLAELKTRYAAEPDGALERTIQDYKASCNIWMTLRATILVRMRP